MDHITLHRGGVYGRYMSKLNPVGLDEIRK